MHYKDKLIRVFNSQGLGSEDGPENPIWTLAKKYKLANTYSDYSSILTYDETGAVNYTNLLDEDYEDAYAVLEQDAGTILSQNLQDRSYRVGLSLANWKPKKSMRKQAVEWWEFDWEYSYSPDQSSETWAIVVSYTIVNERGSLLSYGRLTSHSPRRTSTLLFTSTVTKITMFLIHVVLTLSLKERPTLS